MKFKFNKSYVHSYWDVFFKFKHNWENVYKTMHNVIDNRVKQFRYKLIHKIIPSKELRFIWKISSNPLCNVCNVTESYSHLFIECKEIQNFWDQIITLLNKCGLTNNIQSLKNIVIGYKVNDPNYSRINELFSLIGFSIYKTYFISESRPISINCFSIFKQEFNFMLLNIKHKHKTPSDVIKKVTDFLLV